MIMKKLSDEHYIVVDNSEIKEGVSFLMNGYIIRQCEYVDGYMVIDTTQGKHHVSVCKKITHSTQPLELICCTPEGQIKRYIDCKGCDKGVLGYDKIKPFSLSEVKELLGVVDIEKKVLEYNRKKFVSEFNPKKDQFAAGIIVGWKQALEDNKEKKYTYYDIENAFNSGRGYGVPDDIKDFDSFIQSLQPTEWEVEFVNGKLKLKS